VAAAGVSLIAAVPSNMACEPSVKPSGCRLFTRRWNDRAEPISPASEWSAAEQPWDSKEFVVLISGTMNPPHRAHVLLGINAANYLISQGHTVDSVHFVPGSDNYQWNKIKLKTNSTTELTMADKLTYSMSARVELLNVLISGEPAPEGFSLVADDFEGTIPECFEDSPGYWAKKLPDGYLQTISTATLIGAFAAKHPGKRVAVVFGADNLAYMPTWNHLDKIFSVSDLMVVTRGECRFPTDPSVMLDQFDRVNLAALTEPPQFTDHNGEPVLHLPPGKYEKNSSGVRTMFVLPPIDALESASSTVLRKTILSHIQEGSCEGDVDQLARHGYPSEKRAVLLEAGKEAVEQSEQMLSATEKNGRELGQYAGNSSEPSPKRPKL